MKSLISTTSILLLFVLAGSCQKKPESNEVNDPVELKIAYNVLFDAENDDYEVFVMDLDGSNKMNVTNLPGVEWTYLASGRELYFISDKDNCDRCYRLYRTDANGIKPIQINDFRLADSWMGIRKNNEELIVTPHNSVDSAFYIINGRGSVLQRLDPGIDHFSDPAFSPDGSKIAFRGSRKREKENVSYQDELYIINSDGSGLKQLTNYPESDTTAEWFQYRAGPPRWHPTDNFISFQSFRAGKFSLYRIEPDGSDEQKLTDNIRNEGWHDWSPDGKWLAIEVFDDEQSQFHIGLMDWKSGDMKMLTDTTFRYQQAPVFVVK